jgi:choline-sulfatase
MPARSSFLSGLYSHNHGQWSNEGQLGTGVETYTNLLKESGYYTCHIGKSHLYPHREGHHLDETKPFMRSLGWNDILETTGPWATTYTDSIMTDHWRKIGCLETFRSDYQKRQKKGIVKSTWPSPMPMGETLDDFIGRTAVSYLCNYDRKEPFLLFVGFGGPHDPMDPPADWAEKYNPEDMDDMKPVTKPGSWVPSAAAEHQRKLQSNSLQITPEINRIIRSLYYAKISHIDSWFGQILDTLEHRGFLKNTAIIFWSDHGEMLCDKGRLHKYVFYEESVRVPLIIRPAKPKRAGKVCDSLVSLVDIFPTILDLAGVESDWKGFGKSVMHLIEDPNELHHNAVFSEISVIEPRTMILDKQFKMVVNSNGIVLKLYDLINDPDENINLVAKQGTERTVSRLRHRMLDWYLGTQTTQKNNLET